MAPVLDRCSRFRLRRRMPWTVLAIAVALITQSAASVAVAQIAHVRTITLDDGLPSSEVHDVAQGPDGRIWLATRSGLAVFDGVDWHVVPQPEPLSDAASTFTQVEAASSGDIWVASPHARIPLYSFDGSDWTRSAPFWCTIDSPVMVTALSLLEHTDGSFVALGTPNAGIGIWNGAAWTIVGDDAGLDPGPIQSIVAHGDRWIFATEAALYWLTPDGTVTPWEVEVPGDILTFALLDRSSRSRGQPPLRALTRHAILDVRNDAVDVILDGLDLVTNHGSLVVLHDGTTVAADPRTVIEVPVEGQPPRTLTPGDGLAGMGALSLFEDRQNSLWIAGRRGATVVLSRRFVTYRAEHGLLENEVTAVAELPDGALLLGHNTGITILENDQATTHPVTSRLESDNLTCRILEITRPSETDGSVWLAASNAGLLQLTADRTLRTIAEPGSAVNTAVRDPEGTLWWAGRRIWRLSSTGDITQATSAPHPPVRRLIPVPDGQMLVATTEGLFTLDVEGRLRAIQAADVPGASSVYCVHFGEETTLVGTDAGVFQLSGGRLIRPAAPLSDLSRPVFTISEGPRSALWLGTDDGVYVLDPTHAESLRHLTTPQGLAGREVNRDALFVDSQQQLWIGTDGGVSLYRPRYDERVPLPTVTLLATDVDGTLIDSQKPRSLPPAANTVIFRFLATSFADWGRVRCRARLDGFDGQWSEPLPPSQRWVRYTNLPPGRYKFHVQASGSSGQWTAPVSSAWLTIRGPVSQQWWFAPALMLALTALVGLMTLAGTRWRYARRLETEVAVRRAAEAALDSSRASFAGLVEQNTNGILVTDEHGTIVFANPAASSLLTASGEDLTGTILSPHPAAGQRPLRHLVTGHDSGERHLELSARHIDWHGAPRTLVTVRDITDQTRAEQALRASEERYRNLFERNLAGVFRSTVAGQILECNPAFARIYGYESVVEATQTPAIAFYPTPDDRDAMLQRLRAAGGRLVNVRRRGRRRDGTTLEILENVALVEDDAGELTRLEGTLFDVTDLRKLEEQLFHAQKMEAVGRLAGGLAHDFNNVLQAFQGVSEQLRGEGMDPGRRADAIDELDTLIRRGAALTRQLLLFSRREPAHMEPLDLNEVTRSSSQLLRRLLPERITLHIQLAPLPMPVQGDHGQLEQVILNLAVNAADAIGSNGAITIRARPDDTEAVLEVIDTGCGIPQEELELVFEPFFTTKPRGEGTGLGLAVVDGIVRLHGGSVTLESATGEGTRVAVRIPIWEGNVQQVSHEPSDESVTAPPEHPTVLIVEDDDGARVAFERLVSKLGYNPRSAACLAAAREILEREQIDLVLTDLLLPDGHGGDLVAELAATRPDMPIVCMSGYPDQPVPAVANGQQPLLLMKPFTSAVLAKALRGALGGNVR